ncbi:MAG: peptidylprolyl isomerase [Gemmatimonadaceae bacterium]
MRKLGTILPVMLILAGCYAAYKRPSVLLDPGSSALEERAPERFDVRFETSQGPVLLAVERDLAPYGVDRFYTLVCHGFYDGQRFFRVRAGFIAQFGLSGDPAVIAAWKHRAMPDDPVRETNARGTLAYAMTGPDTRTTQIYINLVDNPKLDAQGFAPFARVTSGMDAVLRLYAGYDESAGGGVRAGKQGAIEAGGNVYLARNFPRLDYIKRAVIVQLQPGMRKAPIRVE